MATTTISPKIPGGDPKRNQGEAPFKERTENDCCYKGRIIYFMPIKPLSSYPGFLKGWTTDNIREDKDR